MSTWSFYCSEHCGDATTLSASIQSGPGASVFALSAAPSVQENVGECNDYIGL